MTSFLFTPQDGEAVIVKARGWREAVRKALGHDDWHAWNVMGYMMVHRFSNGELLGEIKKVIW